MRAQEVMSSPVVTVLAGTTIREAARLLLDSNVTAVPVVDPTGRLVGIVSEVDLLRGHVPPDPRCHLLPVQVDETVPLTVDEVMTRDVVALPLSADCAEFAAQMRRTGVKSVPVVDDGHPVGMVSRRDMLRALARGDDEINREVAGRLREYAAAPDRVHVHTREGVVFVEGVEDPGEARAVRALAYGVPGVVKVEMAPSAVVGGGST